MVSFLQKRLNNCMLKISWDTTRLQGVIYNRDQARTNGPKYIFKLVKYLQGLRKGTYCPPDQRTLAGKWRSRPELAAKLDKQNREKKRA